MEEMLNRSLDQGYCLRAGAGVSGFCSALFSADHPMSTFFPSKAKPYLWICSAGIPLAIRAASYCFSSIWERAACTASSFSGLYCLAGKCEAKVFCDCLYFFLRSASSFAILAIASARAASFSVIAALASESSASLSARAASFSAIAASFSASN